MSSELKALERIEQAVREGRSDKASECLTDDSFFQDAQTGRAIYVRDLRALLRLATRTNPDGLREALEEARRVFGELMDTLRREAPGTPLNNHRFDALGLDANNALAKIDAALASLPHGGEATSPAA